MNFIVTYRGKDGALREDAIAAAGRAECLAECKRRGITPTKIEARDLKGRASGRTPTNGKRSAEGADGDGQEARAKRGRSQDTHGSNDTKDKGRPRVFPVVLGVMVVLAIGAWWWFGGRGATALPAKPPATEKPKAEKRPNAQPAKPNADEATSPAPSVTNKPIAQKKQETYIDERGIERYPGGMRVRRPAARTVKIEIDPRHRFKHTSEAQIAGLLEVKPGSLIVGDMKYSYRFVEDFKESLKEEIEILDTDSEYDKQLKRDVIETKKQLKAAMDRGEDIAQIMTDTRNELKRLGQYRENLKQELRKLRADDNYSDKDLEDFTAAANKMLEENGCRPIKMPTLLIRYIREKQAQAKQNQQEEA